MKTLHTLILATFLISTSAMAAADSVAVFHRPEKVVVLINEIDTNGRLQNFMNSFGPENTLIATTADDSIKIQCGRTIETASCTFRFFPSNEIQISGKTLKARTKLSDMGLSSENFEMLFESSREDKFVVKIIDGNINFYAAKKSL